MTDRHGKAALRVGILNDMSSGPDDPAGLAAWLRLATDELAARGRLDRDVEFVHAHRRGLPGGTAAAVERGFASLVDQDVLMIVGPAIGDNALVATPLAERAGVPTINWAGTERARGDWMFHLPVGSHEDESVLLARHLHASGLRRIGVVHDRSPIGRRHLEFLQEEADGLDLAIDAVAAIDPLAADADAPLRRVLAARIDALVYLGLGHAAPAVSAAASGLGWGGPRLMNTAGIRGYDPAFGAAIDGWTYVDMHADDNVELRTFCERQGIPAAQRFQAAVGRDLGRLVAEGLARAPERTRAGVREGLERVKWLPAAEGHQGRMLGFGHRDRRALHGRYLVLRRWRDGRSVAVD